MTTTCFILSSHSSFKVLLLWFLSFLFTVLEYWFSSSFLPFFLVYSTNSSRRGRKSRIFQFWSITFSNPVQGAVMRLFLDKDDTVRGEDSWELARPQVKFLFNCFQLFSCPPRYLSISQQLFLHFLPNEKAIKPEAKHARLIHHTRPVFFLLYGDFLLHCVCTLSLFFFFFLWLVVLIPTGSNYYKESMTFNHNGCTTCACKCSVILWYFQLVILRKMLSWDEDWMKSEIRMKPLVILHLKKVPDVSFVNHWPRHKTVIWTLPPQ